MERRKDTQHEGIKLPQEYLKLVEDIFNKNFKHKLLKEDQTHECFIANGTIYPDEFVLVLSLKNSKNLRMITCYASTDYPPKSAEVSVTKNPASSSEAVQSAVSLCVDAVAGFFNTFFEEERPVDYDLEYRQNWTPLEVSKGCIVHLRINRDNTELDEQADDLLKLAKKSKKKAQLH